MFVLIRRLICIFILVSAQAFAGDPTISSVLSIDGLKYKLFGVVNFATSFEIAKADSYVLELKGGVDINYDMTHKEIHINFNCLEDPGCGEGLILHYMGMDFVVNTLIYDRETQKFDVRVISMISEVVEGYIEEELNIKLKKPMNNMLDKLGYLFKTKESDVVVIGAAIQSVFRKFSESTEGSSCLVVPGFSGYSALRLIPGSDKVIPFGDVFLHFKKNDPSIFYLYYDKSSTESIRYNRVMGYFNMHPNTGLKVTTALDDSAQEALVTYIEAGDEHGIRVDVHSSMDREIDGTVGVLSGLASLAGGQAPDHNCCDLRIAARTIELMTIRQSKNYVESNYSRLVDEGFPANILNKILGQPLPELH